MGSLIPDAHVGSRLFRWARGISSQEGGFIVSVHDTLLSEAKLKVALAFLSLLYLSTVLAIPQHPHGI